MRYNYASGTRYRSRLRYRSAFCCVPRPDDPFSQACDNVAIVQHRTLPSVGEGGGGRFAYSYFIRLMAEIKWLLVNI